MPNEKIIITSNSCETRIALLKDHRLSEIYFEENSKKGTVANIYKGKVSRVLPGINSAFIDIGGIKTGFLFGGDVIEPTMARETRSIDLDLEGTKPKNVTPIEKILKQGQEIIVQVAKEPIGTKGPRLTQVITLPGRYLVLMPHFRQIGISRRIENTEERERLKGIASKFMPSDLGLIIRTAAFGVTEQDLERDLVELIKSWEKLEAKLDSVNAPSLLYQELAITEKLIRDLFNDQIEEIIVDEFSEFQRLQNFLEAHMPQSKEKLKFYEGPKPIFDHFGIENQLAQALSKKVELKSGGSIVIEQTEALTSIDINTGKDVGKENPKATILKTNLEAAKIICEQLKIRNIGGIIVIDFIDMDDPIDREIIYNGLMEELKNDRARTNVLRISELGVLQMTRKRTIESMSRRQMEECPHCLGCGQVKNVSAESMDMIREILRQSAANQSSKVSVSARKDIIDYINGEIGEVFNLLMKEKKIQVQFEPGRGRLEELRHPSFEVRTSF